MRTGREMDQISSSGYSDYVSGSTKPNCKKKRAYNTQTRTQIKQLKTQEGIPFHILLVIVIVSFIIFLQKTLTGFGLAT